MAKVITVTDIDFAEARIWREVDAAGTTRLYASVGYTLITDEEPLRGEYVVELTGARRTQAVTFLVSLRADIIAARKI